MRQRGERIERSFAHLYDTGGMRRTHLRGHTNILKRLLIHAGGFNLGLVMRHLIGVGTPRGLQGRLAAVIAIVVALWTRLDDMRNAIGGHPIYPRAHSHRVTVSSYCQSPADKRSFTTGFPPHSLSSPSRPNESSTWHS